MLDEFEMWEVIINTIRRWDRKEHNWAVTNKIMPHQNLRTKESFIKSLMKDYKLTKNDTTS